MHIPISLFIFISVIWVVFLIKWAGEFWWDFQYSGFCFGTYILFARDWNLHIIDSLVVGAIDWSFMELDAVWLEWFS